MNSKIVVVAAGAIVLLLSAGQAWTQDEAPVDGEATIRLMGNAEAQLPDAVTNPIALPENVDVDSAAVEHAEDGIIKANENRMRREQGLTTADEAQERGAELTEAAEENRENRGRSEDAPDPGERPDVPQPPNGN